MKLSPSALKDNPTRLQLFALAYPGELPAATGPGDAGAALVANDAVGKAEQDWAKVTQHTK